MNKATTKDILRRHARGFQRALEQLTEERPSKQDVTAVQQIISRTEQQIQDTKKLISTVQ